MALWTNRYNGSLNTDDRLSDLAADHDGKILVTGYSVGVRSGYATIAYSPAGVPLWTNHYAGAENSSDKSTALAVDPSGNVFVTGYSYSSAGANDYVTIAYSGAGMTLWTNRHGGMGNLDDRANAVAVDRSGNVFVTGSSGGDYATIAYSAAGVPFWTNRYNGPDSPLDDAIAVAVDNAGNVFVTGTSHVPGASYDGHYATIAYSAAGVALWTNHYNGNSDDYANALAVDDDGKVFVTGFSSYS